VTGNTRGGRGQGAGRKKTMFSKRFGELKVARKGRVEIKKMWRRRLKNAAKRRR